MSEPDYILSEIRDLLIIHQNHERKYYYKNPFNKFGQQIFSQSDEDGLTLEILRRLKIDKGTFIEFGVGTGLENNTIVLLAMGWRGVWIGGQTMDFPYRPNDDFMFLHSWIVLENIVTLTIAGLNHLQIMNPDVISIDLDGNDIYFIEAVLSHGLRPSLFIVEYNGKFPPPIRFQIDYNPSHGMLGDDYWGASLQTLADKFNNYGYSLVCCNGHSGANAFFIKNTDLHLFPEVPRSLSDCYIDPRFIFLKSYGHPTSAKTIEKIIYGTTII
jgi:hypothetical protein